MKIVFSINSRFLFQQYTDFVKETLFISVKYFKICISKSFMWPRFCFLTLYFGQSPNMLMQPPDESFAVFRNTSISCDRSLVKVISVVQGYG